MVAVLGAVVFAAVATLAIASAANHDTSALVPFGLIGGELAFATLQGLFLVAVYAVIFPVQAIGHHVYGQWARHAYEIDRPRDQAPLDEAGRLTGG